MKRFGVVIALVAVIGVSCGGDKGQSADEVRDDVVALLFAAAANGASANGTDPASVVLAALESNPGLLDGLSSAELQELRAALSGAGEPVGAPSESSVAPDATAATSGSSGTVPSGGATGGQSSGSVVVTLPGGMPSIPVLSIPDVDWGRVSDILNGDGSNPPVISLPVITVPTTLTVPGPMPTIGTVALESSAALAIESATFKKSGSEIVVTIKVVESGVGVNDITSVKLSYIDGGLETPVATRLVSNDSLIRSTWSNKDTVPASATRFKVSVFDKTGARVDKSFQYAG